MGTYEVPLRADFKARLTLPANITRVETIRSPAGR
jgi:hypothetical protein